jgi:hypothetical protein
VKGLARGQSRHQFAHFAFRLRFVDGMNRFGQSLAQFGVKYLNLFVIVIQRARDRIAQPVGGVIGVRGGERVIPNPE